MKLSNIITFTLLAVTAALSAQTVRHLDKNISIIEIDNVQNNYLLLPVQEWAAEAQVEQVIDNQVVLSSNIRLADSLISYFVPIDLKPYKGKAMRLQVKNINKNALCWQHIRLSDEFDSSNTEKFRPSYHFTPPYGWMNDPNGMVYKDGIYHLYYQHNPYGSLWGNMTWGHAQSKDLVHWEHQPLAIFPDAWGTIFSGSSVVDHNNTAGFGKGAIVAVYTSAGDNQTQSIAYSLDNGKTFTKYDKNPVLVSSVPDFRDPKIIWHEASQKWIMSLAVGQEIQFFSSPDLKNWTEESRFGEGQGSHGGVWECPDLFELPIEGTDKKQWVFIVSIGDNGPFGGSATQYFIGDFDGKTFTNRYPDATKWMDFGKDHYATVTWAGIPDNRIVAIAWMSNWKYAQNVPTTQFRSANSVPRELFLFEENGTVSMGSRPVKELDLLASGKPETASFSVKNKTVRKPLPSSGAYRIDLKIKNNNASEIAFNLTNRKGETLKMTIDVKKGEFVMNRNESGLTDFSADFPATTKAPFNSVEEEYFLTLFIDKSSIEVFGNNGKFAMTNLVFPTENYDSLQFVPEKDGYKIEYTLQKLKGSSE
ncbi:MAG: GH32 C-terminal domain-containing protein [Capnocytophaga sp.]|nr:GH32 C-terminal domain-containing protein [Capnocytophaga sp.]